GTLTASGKSMGLMDAAGNFNTGFALVSLASNVISALSSDDPANALLAIIGLNFGGEAEYTLSDLRSELFDVIAEQQDSMGLLALTQAQATTSIAMQQIAMFREDKSEINAEALIATADKAFFEAINYGETCISELTSPTTISAAIAIVSEALAVRMAVVEEAQDGAWGKDSIKALISEAKAFFDFAETKYQQERDAYLKTNPVTTTFKSAGVEPAQIRIYSEHDVSAEINQIDAMVGTGASFSSDGTIWVTGRHVAVNTASEFGKFLDNFEKMGISFSGSTNTIYINAEDAFQIELFKLFVDSYLSKANATKEGYAFADGEGIGQIADIYQSLIDGDSIGKDVPLGTSSRNEDLQDGTFDDALNGTEGKDYIDGKDYHDEINGLGGRDVIKGGSGRDVIDGGAGADVLYGGTKENNDDLDGDRDTFLFRNPEDVDLIKEFEVHAESYQRVEGGRYEVHHVAGDLIAIDLVAFGADHLVEKSAAGDLDTSAFVVGRGNATKDTRVFQEGGDLYFDADGSGNGYDAVHFATIIGAGDLEVDNFAFI
ncbi:MAG: hypothetical protein NXH94_16220, partial [Rhodobacteraceae bacterium]|nr:hypothetical protein [Paracoccaceae bacterium]